MLNERTGVPIIDDPEGCNLQYERALYGTTERLRVAAGQPMAQWYGNAVHLALKALARIGPLAVLLICVSALYAQPLQQVHPNPDCQFFFTLTSATAPNNVLPSGSGFDNRQQGCTAWDFSYVNSGFTGLTVTLESAANNNGVAGSFSAGFAVQQNTISGSNAATNTTGGFWWVQGTNAWVHVKLSGITGTGVVNGAVFGWRIPNAGGTGGGSGLTCLTGDVAAGSGSGCTTATVQGIETVPFCSGYSPTNGQFVQYTTGGSPSPCYGAATDGWPFTIIQEASYGSNAGVSSDTVTFPQALQSGGATAFMIVAADGSTTVTVPSGWTTDINQTQATFARLLVLHKTSAGDTSATFGVTNANVSVYFFELSGTHALDQSSSSGAANEQLVPLPAITPTANSVVFGAACIVTVNTVYNLDAVLNPMWRSVQASSNLNGSRSLVMNVARTPAANVATTPPALSLVNAILFASGGIAYATFSIL